WAARWFTPYTGLSNATAYPLAAATPTSSAPASPGPAVTAIASTSASRTPASSNARCMVGTIASRWARLATSGTTPPYRACRSTLEASASASRVRPRTIPTPVSSHEVSIPRTSGSSFTEHHQRIRVTGLVVAPPQSDRHEPERLVQPLRRLVGHRHLQQHPGHPAPLRLGQQPGQQPPTDPSPLRVPAHRQRVHPRFVRRHHRQPGVPQQPAVGAAGGQIVVPLGELALQHPPRPPLGAEQILLDRQHLIEVGQLQAYELDVGIGHGRVLPGSRRGHGRVTRLGGCGSEASGRRRYSGVSGSAGSLANTRDRATRTRSAGSGCNGSSTTGNRSTSR